MINDKSQTATMDDVVEMSHAAGDQPLCRVDVAFGVSAMRKGYAIYLVQPTRGAKRGAIVAAAGPEGAQLCPLPDIGNHGGLMLPPTGKRTPARIRYVIARHYGTVWGINQRMNKGDVTVDWPIPYRDAGGRKVVPKEVNRDARAAKRELDKLAAASKKVRAQAKTARDAAKKADAAVARAATVTKTAAKAAKRPRATVVEERKETAARRAEREAKADARKAAAAARKLAADEKRAKRERELACKREIRDWERRKKLMMRAAKGHRRDALRLRYKDKAESEMHADLAKQFITNAAREDAHYKQYRTAA